MEITEFDFEFYSKVPDPGDALRRAAERRLWELAEGYEDMIGASVALEELTQEVTPHVFEARVVAYIKPDNIAAVEKSDSALGALKGALSAVERQVRELRSKLGHPWKRPDLEGGAEPAAPTPSGGTDVLERLDTE
jgi:ribosome-associated translation inhibitor RaiA